MLFRPPYQRGLDYSPQAVTDLLCGQLTTTRSQGMLQSTPPSTHRSTHTHQPMALEGVVFAKHHAGRKNLFRTSHRRWLRLGRAPQDLKFTSKDWPQQLKSLISLTAPTSGETTTCTQDPPSTDTPPDPSLRKRPGPRDTPTPQASAHKRPCHRTFKPP